MTTVPLQSAPVAAPQVVFYQQGPVQPVQKSLNSKAAIITGYMQIGISVGSVAFGIACICLEYLQGYIAVPIWGALGFYLVAGILGVVAGHSKGQNNCAIVGCLVMSILAAVTAGVHVIIGSISSAYHDYYYYYNYQASYAVNILSTLVGVMELVVAIIASVYMCRGASCCCGGPPKVNSVACVVQPPGQVGNQVIHGYPMMQQQYFGQPQVMGQPQFMAQSQVMGQPQFMGQPHQNTQYMSQAQCQLPAYSEHETKEVPQ